MFWVRDLKQKLDQSDVSKKKLSGFNDNHLELFDMIILLWINYTQDISV